MVIRLKEKLKGRPGGSASWAAKPPHNSGFLAQSHGIFRQPGGEAATQLGIVAHKPKDFPTPGGGAARTAPLLEKITKLNILIKASYHVTDVFTVIFNFFNIKLKSSFKFSGFKDIKHTF